MLTLKVGLLGFWPIPTDATITLSVTSSVVVGFVRVLWLIDGVREQLTRANDREIRDHLDSRILKHLQEGSHKLLTLSPVLPLTLNISYDLGHFL